VSSKRNNGRYLLFMAVAGAACVQWLACRALGIHPGQPWTALLPGLCIFGAAFLLTWAAEAAEVDLPQSISVGLLALIAVLPEYAVDMYFAWTAGKDPTYTAYATANMTGANRLLIGVGWPAVLAAAWWARGSREIHLSKENALELVTLLAATAYSFFIPLKGNLSVIDTVILIGLFGAYGWKATHAEVAEPDLEGPAEMIGELDTWSRRGVVISLMVFAAVAIGLSAEPFAEGILEAGRHWGIEEFILVQWLAPLASEAPEFIIAILFATKGKAAVGMRALISSKVNQWTLLVGMLPAVFNLSSGSLTPMHLDPRQVEEIFLTSAQSLFALVLLMNLSFSAGEAAALLLLFATQIAFPQPSARWAFAFGYIALSVAMLTLQGNRLKQIRDLARHAFGPRTPA